MGYTNDHSWVEPKAIFEQDAKGVEGFGVSDPLQNSDIFMHHNPWRSLLVIRRNLKKQIVE